MAGSALAHKGSSEGNLTPSVSRDAPRAEAVRGISLSKGKFDHKLEQEVGFHVCKPSLRQMNYSSEIIESQVLL